MREQTRVILERLDASPDWRKTLLKLYKIGASDREVMCELKLSRGAWAELYQNPLDCDFQELVELGRLWAHAWWETQGRENLLNNKFQTALYTIQMKNRFGWSEKSEQSMTNIDLKNLNDEELSREIKELLAAYQKGRAKGTV